MAVFTGNGSAASPSFTFSSDTNTGIFRPATDVLAVATNGTQRITVTSDGKLGIFDNAPVFGVSIGTGTVALGLAAQANSLRFRKQDGNIGGFAGYYSADDATFGLYNSSGGGGVTIGGQAGNIIVESAPGNTIATFVHSGEYLRMASGTGGIQFNNDTAAANALDDYEEGTFSPIPTNFTSPLLLQSRYTKIGRRVFVEFYWVIGAANAPYTYNPADIADWTGLPFSANTWAINGIAVSLGSQNGTWAAFGPPGSGHKEFIIVGERTNGSIRLLDRSTGAFATWGDLVLTTSPGASPGVRASFSYESA